LFIIPKNGRVCDSYISTLLLKMKFLYKSTSYNKSLNEQMLYKSTSYNKSAFGESKITNNMTFYLRDNTEVYTGD